MTIGRAFLLWVVGFLVLTLVLVSVLHLRTVQQALDEELRNHARVMARSLAEAVALGEVPENLPVLTMQDVRAVEVRDGSGRLLWAVGPGLDEVRVIDSTVLEIMESVPVRSEARIPGNLVEVVLLVSRARLRQQVAGSALQLVAGLGVALLIALVIGLALVGRVVRPLHDLAEHARTFHPGRPFTLSMPTGTSSEVQEMAHAFSEMADRLAAQRQALEASELRFRELFASSPAPLLELDSDLRVLGANQAAASLLAAEPDEAIGRLVPGYLEEGGRGATPAARLREAISTAERSGEGTLETRWRLADGVMADVELHLRPVGGRETASYLISIHDLTDQLRRMGERWRRTFDAMVDGVALVENDGTVRLCNLALQPHLSTLRPEISSHAAIPGSVRWQTSSGERLLQCTLTVHEGLSQRILVVRDVTEAVRAEARLREVQKMEAVATLASGVAHDFNNLLAGVLLHVRWLLHRPEKSAQAAEAIRTLAEEGIDVVRELLLFARRESTPHRLLDLQALVSEQEAVLRHLLPQTTELRISIGSQPVPVIGSPVALRRVLLNLVLNARDAVDASDGRITISLARSGELAELRVSDNGQGIPEEVRERLFEPFFSLHREGRGAGLGLAVVYAIVGEHGGEIDVDSVEHEGSTFSIRLPLVLESEAEPAPLADADEGLCAGRRVLLVEADGKVATRLIEELVAVGLDVRHAQTPEAARELAADWPPHVVISEEAVPAMADEPPSSLQEIPLVITGQQCSAAPDAGGERASDGERALVAESRSPQAILQAVRTALERRRG